MNINSFFCYLQEVVNELTCNDGALATITMAVYFFDIFGDDDVD